MPCTTILVGKAASNDGSTIIARTDDGGFEPKRLAVMLPEKQPCKYKSVIAHLTIALPDTPMRYTYIPNVSRKNGTWPACGINEANVAMTATETITSNPRVQGADPLVVYHKKEGKKPEVPGGIGEEDLVTLVLPYIRSAREGVKRLGALLEQYGTYEANGIAFADADEIWWLESIGGHHWIAHRVPDNRVVLMPNQFGLDTFDFDDAMGAQKENMCCADLLDFVKKYDLNTDKEGQPFNPRHAFGSRSDTDHIYNTPRAWFMARYFLENTYRFDGDGADFNPESNNLPWSLIPERAVTVEDVRYLLGSYYQGTPYNPYVAASPLKGKYRVIGVPNSDDCGILQIRGNKPAPIQGVEWLSMGGSGFTACFPMYANVSAFPAYVGGTTETVSTDAMYWHSRMIASLTDAHYTSAILFDERYQNAVLNQGRKIVDAYDERLQNGEDVALLETANKEIADMVKKESDSVLEKLLNNAGEHMKTRYHRGDN